MSSASLQPPDKIELKAKEQPRLELEQETWASDANNIDDLVQAALEDFSEEKSKLEDVADAIARHNITDKTRADGCEGKKVFQLAWNRFSLQFATAVSIRAALTYFYKTLHPEENVMECYGLPTHSPIVSQFMIGLEKTKAAAGETSQSASALMLEDMHSLHQLCLEENGLSVAERRWGVVRYATYLLAWLLLLRIEEVVHLTFESIYFHPGCYYDITFVTRKSVHTGVTHTWRL
ncbi:hypothetical protein JB92DRAFT_3092756 [Gautieria morchelliformis]|nr:hypothetical protein JB92DRAFT_3092756 [Gautieria morchelliformis]